MSTDTILTDATTPETPTTPAPDPVAPVAPEVPAAPVVPVAAVPETYTLTPPETFALDASAVERTVAFARDRGLSNAAAQAALDLANTEVSTAKAALLADHQPGGTAWTTMVDGWKAETLADPSLGRTPDERTAAVQKGVNILTRFTEAHPDQKEAITGFLNTSGLGNHPTVVRLFKWLGESASEGSLVTSQIGGDGQKSDAELFYGSSTK